MCKDVRERGEGGDSRHGGEGERDECEERERERRTVEREEGIERERERERGKSKSNSGPFCKIRGWRNSATEKEIEFREKDIRGVPL